MDTEQRFRRIFAAFLVPFGLIRIAAKVSVGSRRAQAHQEERDKTGGFKQRWLRLTAHENQLSVATRIALVPLFVLCLWRYFTAARSVRRYALPFPVWLRWLGAVLGFTSLPVLGWTHLSLGRGWSTNLELQPEHSLVTTGPYHWVRHPMYTAFLAFFAGSALVTANGLIIAPTALASWLIIARMGDEETMMLTQFGVDYRAYSARTGRLLPRLHVLEPYLP